MMFDNMFCSSLNGEKRAGRGTREGFTKGEGGGLVMMVVMMMMMISTIL